MRRLQLIRPQPENPATKEIVQGLVEKFVDKTTSTTAATNSPIFQLAVRLKKAQAHLSLHRTSVLVALFMSMVLNSGVPDYVASVDHSVIFVTSLKPTTPSHWSPMSNSEPKLFILRQASETDKIPKFLLAKNTHETLLNDLYKKYPQLKHSDSHILNHAHIVDAYISNTVHENEQKVSKIHPYDVRSYIVPVEILETAEKLIKFINVKKLGLKPLNAHDIVNFIKIPVTTMNSWDAHSKISDLRQPFAERQRNLALKVSSDKTVDFNRIDLFPWFVLGGMWNHQTQITFGPIISFGAFGIKIDSIFVMKRSEVYKKEGGYFI